MASKEIDITKTGPMGYRALQQANEDPFESIRPEIISQTDLYEAPAPVQSPLANANIPWGESMWDETTVNQTEFENLGDIRAENQPAIAKLGAGVAKAGVLAASTFASGVVGLPLGIAEAIKEGKISKIWDNDVNNTLNSFIEKSEEVLPNYYTQDEIENPLALRNIFSTNFLGDKFIKNIGFTVGAFYSGNVYSKGLTGILKFLKATSNSSRIAVEMVGSALSAANEGSFEALNAANDYEKKFKPQLDENYKNSINQLYAEYRENAGKQLVMDHERGELYDPAYARYQAATKALKEDYDKAMARLQMDKAKVGNTVLLQNMAILTASNYIQFAKQYAKGFTSASRQNADVRRTAAGYGARTYNNLEKAGITMKGAVMEGVEEGSQQVATDTSINYYSDDFNNFYRSLKDPEAEQKTLSWVNSFSEALVNDLQDESMWEQFLVGSLTGAMGMPHFRSARNAQGKLRSPITLEGGIVNEWRELNKKDARNKAMADELNQRINDPEFRNYYQSLIRHFKYDNDMVDAAARGDAFDFKNAEFAQLLSDINMFARAGRLQDLKEMVGDSFNTATSQELEEIVKKTTSVSADGKLEGPYAKYASVDKTGNVTVTMTEEDQKEMKKSLEEDRTRVTSVIEKYEKAREEFDKKTGYSLTDDQLDELVWMKTQVEDWGERSASMSENIKSVIENVLNSLDALLRFNVAIRDREGASHVEPSELYKKAEENVGTIEEAIKNLKSARDLDDKAFAVILANNPKFIDGLIKQIENLDEAVLSEEEKQNVITQLNDLTRLGKAAETYNSKLKEYLSNPQKQAEDHATMDEEAVKKEDEKKSSDLKTSLSSVTSLKDFRAIVANEEDKEKVGKILQELEDSGNAMAKNYRETSQYMAEARHAILQSDADPETKQDALKLLQDQFDNSETLEELANLYSVFINNENAFDQDSESVELSASRFIKAQYEAQRAMSKVNNDNKFKDRFSDAYKKPVDKPQDTKGKGTDKDTTGDSGVATVPPVGASDLPIAMETLVGDITSETVAEENKETNERTETPEPPKRGETRRYYRPAIPELHIEASKEGDFRPFDIVVKEREQGVDFSEIYKYLVDAGAFEYLNAGNLKVGDEIGFMIDLDFNDHTIFIINKRDGQVIGSLDESGYAVAKFEGLAELEKRIRKELPSISSQQRETLREYANGEYFSVYYRSQSVKEGHFKVDEIEIPLTAEEEERQEQYAREHDGNYDWSIFRAAIKRFLDSKFIATPTTRVSKIMIGKIPYGTEERNLSDIPNVSENGGPIFGIIKNGTLGTNGKVDDSLIMKPVDMANKEGRLYLLVPNGAGKYSPVAVRVKHFNNEEFNLNKMADTPMGKDIKAALDKLSNATSQDDVSEAMKELAGDLYMQDVMVTWFDAQAGSGIVISRKIRKPDGTYEKIIIDGKEQIKEEKHSIYFSSFNSVFEVNGIEYELDPADPQTMETLRAAGIDPSSLRNSKDPEQIYKEILEYLMKLNLPLQVSARRINSGGYNGRLVNSGILTSNILNASTKGTWFTLDYFDREGNLQKAVNPTSVNLQPKRKAETPVGGKEGAIAGTRITFSGSDYYVDLQTNTIRDDQGRVVAANELLFDLAWAQDNFGDMTVSPEMIDNKVITPSGKVLDRTKQKYLEGKEAKDAKDAIAKRNKEEQEGIMRSEAVIGAINEDQKRVDKTRTDNESYYVLEDDGEYHKYDSVHKRLGPNAEMSPKQKEALDFIRANLSKHAEDLVQYDNYLTFLENKYKTNLTDYRGKTDIQSRNAIMLLVQNAMTGSARTLNAGTEVDREKGIPITYNPAISVPLDANSHSSKGKISERGTTEEGNLPIFNSSLELQNPKKDLTPDHSMNAENERVGYFEMNGELHEGYLTPLAVIGGVEVHLTKVPSITRGFGNNEAHVAANSYYAVFPNGKTFLLLQNNPVQGGHSEVDVLKLIKEKLEGNPQRVRDLSNEKTILFDPKELPSTGIQKGAAFTAQREQAVNPHDDEYEDELVLRKAEKEAAPVWNMEQELAWIEKVLPQVSREDRIKIVKGLIKVGKRGELAWGQFDKGIITLSDIAAEGTLYHEAFHAVFRLLLDPEERQALYDEARKMYGEKDELSLEEDMAEGFREYVMTRQNRSLGRKILDFFKELFAKVTHWNDFRPSLTSYYRRINNGYYANRELKEQGKVPTISELRRHRKASIKETSEMLDDEYRRAKDIVKGLNGRRYNTEAEALAAFRNSGINNNLFYRITRRGANNAAGYKIQLLTTEQFNEYKDIMLSGTDESTNWYFDSLDPDVQMALLNKGWTKEKFDSVSQEERDHAIDCIAF